MKLTRMQLSHCKTITYFKIMAVVMFGRTDSFEETLMLGKIEGGRRRG